MTMIKLTSRACQTALALIALAMLVAACGSSSSSSSSSSSASASTAAGSNSQRTALAACLKKHGVTLPTGQRPGAGAPPGGAPGAGSGNPPAGVPGGGSGTPPAGGPPGGFPGGAAGNSKFRAAFNACGANFPAGRRPGGFNRQAIQKYVSCVRSHGYNLPNANFSGNGPVFPANIRSNRKFQTASKACQSLLAPSQGGGNTSGA